MNRTGLIIALVIGAIAGAVFALDPALDLAIAAPFHAINSGGNLFGLRISPPLMLLRNSMLWFVTLVAFVPGGVLLLKLMRPTRPMLIAPRAVLLLLASLALGPGLLTNVILKDNWGRSRPIDVRESGGQETFVPWYSPRGDCPNNCSFVSGDVSGAAWLIAPAALRTGWTWSTRRWPVPWSVPPARSVTVSAAHWTASALAPALLSPSCRRSTGPTPRSWLRWARSTGS